MAAFVVASLVKPVAYEIFLKMHELSAALLAYLLLSQLLADSSFNRLSLYIFGGVSGLLNVFFISRYGYYNFAGWRWPTLVYSEIATSKIHNRTWLHLELRAPRRIHVKPGQYISMWIPGVQLLSSHPFATTTTDAEHRTVFHVFIQAESGITKTLIKPVLPSAVAVDDLEKQAVVVSLSKGRVVQTNQVVNRNKFRPRFAFFTGPHGRSVDHRKFERVILVASGCGYWCLDGYLEDMLRAEPGGTRTRKIVLVYKGTPCRSCFGIRSSRSLR
jgi:FAD-binding domain